MAIAMRTQMNRTRTKILFVGLALGVSLAGATSCWSADEAPLGRRAEHPDPRAPRPSSSADGAVDAGHPPPEGPFSPLDKAIAEDCLYARGLALPRAWSQNVPERDCTNDGECGDGYCDRGRCAAIWTCGERFGQRCVNGEVARNPQLVNHRCPGLCLEGRCRSCVSDEECVKDRGIWRASCNPGREKNGAHRCGILGVKIDKPVPSPSR
jgi:hypothetical protein